MQEIVLTVVISTYQRARLMKANLKRMLRCGDMRVEFLVGDNASTDQTWNELADIQDTRVRKVRNKVNYGFENFWLLSFLARGQYFMFVNDRDYVEPKDIQKLCDALQTLAPCDFISSERTGFAPGYYGWKEAVELYFRSRHPGTLIYRTAFIRKVLHKDRLLWYLAKGYHAKANNYLVFQILLHVKRTAVYPRYFVNQPPNRERIPQVRKEYYGCSYVSEAYRAREFDDWMKSGLEYLEQKRTRSIMRAVYRDSLRTVTWEYYYSMKIPGFAERAGLHGHVPGEWFWNGIRLTCHIFKNPDLKKYSIRLGMVQTFVDTYLHTVWNVLK